MTERGKSRLRLLRPTPVLALLAVAGVVLTVVLLKWQDGNMALGIISGIATVITFLFLLIDRVRAQATPPQVDTATEDLRMRLLEQWEPEVRRRVQRSPHSRTIPVEWRARGHTGTGSSQLDGRFEGDPDEAAKQLADAFHQLPRQRRMVVLGEPGSGKTFFALALTVGLLRQWTEGDPIAVFLPLSSWDPLVETLDDWAVGNIATTYYGGDQRTPRTLLTARRLIPVLDGLDELPEHLRRLAVRRVNDCLTGDRPLVVTCRTAEYEEVLAGGSPALLRAPAVEVQPVATADLVTRLKDEPAWQKVVRHIESHPAGHVAEALRTPLMLSFFTAVYEYRSPAELLDKKRFGSKHAVEDHLVDLRLDTAYPSEPPPGQWSAAKVKKWLTYLARHMHEHDERSVTWWQLAYRAVEGGHLLTALALVSGIWVLDMVSQPNVAIQLLRSEPFLALILGSVLASFWLANRRAIPGRRRPDRNSRARGFKRGMAVGAIAVLGPGLFAVGLSALTSSGSYQSVMQISADAYAMLTLALVHGLVVGLHEMMVEHSTAKHTARAARDLLKLERVSTFLAAGIAGLIIGPLSIVTAAFATSYGTHVGQWFAAALDFPTVFHPERPESPVTWYLLREAGALIALTSAIMLAASRAWPRLLAARVKLACTRRLPWRLGRFVTDATRRGLLRRAGVAYEFGHVLLQERLVSTAVNYPPLHRRPWLRNALVGSAVLVMVIAAIVAWSGKPKDCDGQKGSWIGAPMIRTEDDQSTACFAYVHEDRWEKVLGQESENAQLLADIKAQLPKPEGKGPVGSGVVLIVGKFDEIRSTKRHDVLAGIAAAQQVTKGSIDIDFIYADLEANRGKKAAALIELHLEDAKSRAEIGADNHRGSAVVGLDFDWSLPDRHTKIVGLNDAELQEHAKERRNAVISSFLRSSPPRPAVPSCDEVKTARDSRSVLDMRPAHLSVSMLNELSKCGATEVMVEQPDAMKLNLLPDRTSDVKIHFLSDRSSTIVNDCAQALRAIDTDIVSVKACVAVVSANESFRIGVEELPPPVS